MIENGEYDIGEPSAELEVPTDDKLTGDDLLSASLTEEIDERAGEASTSKSPRWSDSIAGFIADEVRPAARSDISPIKCMSVQYN